MVIAPVVNGFACLTFFLFYHMYKYKFLWQYNVPSSSDTGGLFFPKALQHVFVGMYVQQVCHIVVCNNSGLMGCVRYVCVRCFSCRGTKMRRRVRCRRVCSWSS